MLNLIKTARSIQNSVPEGMVPIVKDYWENGWSYFLGSHGFWYLTQIIDHIYEGLTAEETIIAMEVLDEIKAGKGVDSTWFDFNKTEFKDDKDRELYMEELEIESERKKVLEQSGYYYPRSVRQMVDLLERFNIVHRIPNQSKGCEYFDVVLSPFPHVKDYLKGEEVKRWIKRKKKLEEADKR
jgi:hypothetical protein